VQSRREHLQPLIMETGERRETKWQGMKEEIEGNLAMDGRKEREMKRGVNRRIQIEASLSRHAAGQWTPLLKIFGFAVRFSFA
jgi:hypothetical protein